ncbi:putative transposase [Kosakonia arachidis]|uniref:Putative transposase n=1 Tax=Kosakonia arachidis TaxID=551989 RepID=A0A1I6ZEY0_9ENTR|nr:putative transposase [Kosakonia arachidis]
MSFKKVLRPLQKRESVDYLLEAYRIGLRGSCRLMMQNYLAYNYRRCRDDRALTQRISEIAAVRVCYGYQRIFAQDTP